MSATSCRLSSWWLTFAASVVGSRFRLLASCTLCWRRRRWFRGRRHGLRCGPRRGQRVCGQWLYRQLEDEVCHANVAQGADGLVVAKRYANVAVDRSQPLAVEVGSAARVLLQEVLDLPCVRESINPRGDVSAAPCYCTEHYLDGEVAVGVEYVGLVA